MNEVQAINLNFRAFENSNSLAMFQLDTLPLLGLLMAAGLREKAYKENHKRGGHCAEICTQNASGAPIPETDGPNVGSGLIGVVSFRHVSYTAG